MKQTNFPVSVVEKLLEQDESDQFASTKMIMSDRDFSVSYTWFTKITNISLVLPSNHFQKLNSLHLISCFIRSKICWLLERHLKIKKINHFRLYLQSFLPILFCQGFRETFSFQRIKKTSRDRFLSLRTLGTILPHSICSQFQKQHISLYLFISIIFIIFF